MKRLLTIIALGILLPTTLVAAEPRTHIDYTLVKFVTAFNAGDGATVASFYSEDAALFPPGGERVDGRSAIQAFWQGAIDSGMKIDDLHAIEVDSRSDIAGEIGVFILSVPGESTS
jgi:ketosteroid isomerase-like protein